MVQLEEVPEKATRKLKTWPAPTQKAYRWIGLMQQITGSIRWRRREKEAERYGKKKYFSSVKATNLQEEKEVVKKIHEDKDRHLQKQLEHIFQKSTEPGHNDQK